MWAVTIRWTAVFTECPVVSWIATKTKVMIGEVEEAHRQETVDTQPKAPVPLTGNAYRVGRNK